MKKEKTIKKLSDGTIARVGLIVVLGIRTIGGNTEGAIVKITKIVLTGQFANIERDHAEPMVFCSLAKQTPIWISGWKGPGSPKTPSYYERCNNLRKATASECREYRASIKSSKS